VARQAHFQPLQRPRRTPQDARHDDAAQKPRAGLAGDGGDVPVACL
jgi:hypothetical protein